MLQIGDGLALQSGQHVGMHIKASPAAKGDGPPVEIGRGTLGQVIQFHLVRRLDPNLNQDTSRLLEQPCSLPSRQSARAWMDHLIWRLSPVSSRRSQMSRARSSSAKKSLS